MSDVFLNMDMKQPTYIKPEEEKKDEKKDEQDDDDFERDDTDQDAFQAKEQTKTD